VVLGVPAVGWLVGQQTLLQRQVEDRYLGRIFGVFGTTNALMLVDGLAAGALADITGIVALLDVSAGPYLGGHVLAVFLARGRRKAKSA
jgi:hypothetical protein